MKYALLALFLTGCVSDCRPVPAVYIEEVIGGSSTDTIYEQLDGFIDGGMASVHCKHNWMK